MDRSLDDTIAERRTRQPPRTGRRGPGSVRRDEGPRDGIRKPGNRSAANVGINEEWVHDRYDEDRGDGRRGGPRIRDAPRIDRWMPNDFPAEDDDYPKIRIENLHYELTERDVEGVFAEAGPIRDCRILYDRQDRSRGVAIITYTSMYDAERAVRDYNGQFAKGQRIRVFFDDGPPGRGRGAERNGRSLADRINTGRAGSERRNGRDVDEIRERGERRRRRSMSPMAIDRPARSAAGGRGGRRPGQRRDDSNRAPRREGDAGAQGRGQGGTRPRKTKEQLDAEMEDYFTPTADGGDAAQDAPAGGSAAAPGAPQDGDVDMIE